MPFLLLLCLSLACLPTDWPAPRFAGNPLGSLIGTVGLCALLLAYAVWVTVRVRLRMESRPERRDRWLSDYSRARTRFALLAMFVFVVALYAFGWGWAVQSVMRGWAGDGPLPVGTELIILLPLPICLLLSWTVFYDAERAILDGVRPYGGRIGYVGLQTRQNLLMICLPVVFLALAQGIFRQFPATRDDQVQSLILLPFGVLAVIFMPWFVRAMLNLRSLPAGPLRDRLEAAAKRLNCRCSDILLWDTKNGVVNAMVVGVVPWVRYVLLSDRLVRELEPDEVEAVFGHEVGHVKHSHMLYYLAFLTGSLAVLSRGIALLETSLKSAWPESAAASAVAGLDTWMALPATGALAVYIFGVFGFLSRRCERQADVYACRTVSCPDADCLGHDDTSDRIPHGAGVCPAGIRTFCNALDKVAILNGMSRDRPGWLHSWQHSTIGKRVAFLKGMIADPTLEPRFQRRLFALKAAMLVAMVVAGALLYVVPDQKGNPLSAILSATSLKH